MLAKNHIFTAFLLGALAASPARGAVEINGLDDALRQNVLAHLALADEPCDAPSPWVQRRFRKAPAEIRAGLAALGYYSPNIESELDTVPDCWRAVFTIDAGRLVRVRVLDIDISGGATGDSNFARVLRQSPLQTGQAFRHDYYEKLKRSLADTASRLGYADSKFVENKVDVYPAEEAADITIRFVSGERYAFGNTTFEQSALSEDFIVDYLPYARGDSYDNRLIAELYSVLAGSGYFDQIEVRPQIDARENGEIPVVVTLTPGNRRIYTAGLGFSTNTGARARFGYTNRRLNTRGHQLGMNGLLSDVVSEATANYRLPYGDPSSEWLSFDGGFKHEATDTSESDTWQVGVRRVKRRKYGWQETQFFDFLFEDFVVGEQRDDSALGIPGVSWLKTTSDDRLRPRRGFRAFLEISGSADALGSDSSFVQFDGNVKWVRPAGERGRLLFRAEAGFTLADRFIDLPPSVRFFAGGDSSVRGYGYKTLGPKDSEGSVIGGKAKLIGSAEYEFDVLPKWSVATFVDSGNAFNNFDLDTQTGAGAGARWRSPLGPVRLDIAKPFNGPDRSTRIHITFGPDL